MKKLKRAGVFIICVVVFLLIAIRAWPRVVPWGASVQPFLLASHSGGTLNSPDNQRELKVYFNDAGAMHSGNFWVWVVEDDWLLGPRVVNEGYLLQEHSNGTQPIPITWSAGNNFTIDFRPGRYD